MYCQGFRFHDDGISMASLSVNVEVPSRFSVATCAMIFPFPLSAFMGTAIFDGL
jgi:hypothetical protein